ncbi:conserved hypothetical protein [Thiomonas arsenitoxydans]|uniref:Uncharacterized protein n=1 Tax=Thiomonas arsenitoxydans (strain DSM 22701 / CIP 110005 / 3As) TaxID=426114 RepID=D6CSA8_THIA3|nr:Hypothetical protein THI_0934 [Thiomonas arsenitoxydans]CQR30311.1 conserved hypothetical protein [Thiomonas arsenitoxydans]
MLTDARLGLGAPNMAAELARKLMTGCEKETP